MSGPTGKTYEIDTAPLVAIWRELPSSRRELFLSELADAIRTTGGLAEITAQIGVEIEIEPILWTDDDEGKQRATFRTERSEAPFVEIITRKSALPGLDDAALTKEEK